MNHRVAFSLASLLLLGHALTQGREPRETYRSVITKPVLGPGVQVGKPGFADFDAISDALNRMHDEGYSPNLLEVFVDRRRFDYGQNRVLIGGPAEPVGQVARDDEPYRAVLTRPIIGPSWKAGQDGYVEFPAVTGALNQLSREGYEPIHMELYTDPVPGRRRAERPLNRLLIVGVRR